MLMLFLFSNNIFQEYVLFKVFLNTMLLIPMSTSTISLISLHMLLFNVQLDWISRQQSAPERDASTASSVGCATQEQIVTGFVLPGETPRIRIPTLLLVYLLPCSLIGQALLLHHQLSVTLKASCLNLL